jgi:glutaconate CoA-transferase subunit B
MATASRTYTATEMMTIAAARALRSHDICFVGIGMPSAACNLARLTHAPDLTLIYESGTIATKPDVLPLSIGDGELCETALTTVSVPEMFRYWLQGGRFTVGFLGGAQIDRFANLNTTVVGSYDKPRTRLPGGGGAPEISSA